MLPKLFPVYIYIMSWRIAACGCRLLAVVSRRQEKRKRVGARRGIGARMAGACGSRLFFRLQGRHGVILHFNVVRIVRSLGVPVLRFQEEGRFRCVGCGVACVCGVRRRRMGRLSEFIAKRRPRKDHSDNMMRLRLGACF